MLYPLVSAGLLVLSPDVVTIIVPPITGEFYVDENNDLYIDNDGNIYND